MANLRASEFGGTTQRNGIAPPLTPRGHRGHEELTAAEKLHLVYATGQEEDTTADPEPMAFEGLEPLEIALAKMPVQTKWIDVNG